MMPASALEQFALAGAQFVAGLLDGMPDAVWLVEAGSLRIVAANVAAGEMLGVEAAALCGQRVIDLCGSPEDVLFWTEAAVGPTPGIDSQTCLMRPDGAVVTVTRRVTRLPMGPPVRSNAKPPVASSVEALALDGITPAHEGGDAHHEVFLVVLHDCTEYQRVRRAFEQRVAELAATLESTADGLLTTDMRGGVRHFNHAFATLWGIPDSLQCERDDEALNAFMAAAVIDGVEYAKRLAELEASELCEAVDTISLRNGRVLQRVTMPQWSHGREVGRVYSFRDITMRLHARLNAPATLASRCDVLTGLPTRSALADRVEFAVALAQRDQSPFALLFANLDRFKQVNDTWGRDFGDRVLVDVAERLRGSLRQVDMVVRVGSDEFVILVHQADAAGAEAAAQRVLDIMQQPFVHGGLEFTLTCSIGIALYPQHGTGLDELMRHADAAMQGIKSAGRAAYRFHHGLPASTIESSVSRLRLDTAMRQALQHGYFRLHYQPQVDMQTGSVHGAEALIRWHDPHLGPMSPAQFIPAAERSGFIVSIGDWVLREAVAQAGRWHAQGRKLIVSVNVSAVQFHRSGFVECVSRALQSVRLPPHLLELELTESILIQDAQEALLRLQALSALGVKLAIDDFGTGYSSLGYLKRFPIDRLKIDRSFVRGLPGDESDVGIVNAIVNLGRALRLEVVAKGVETEAQHRFLQQTGCEQYQGFLFAPALDSVSFEQRLAFPNPNRSAD